MNPNHIDVTSLRVFLAVVQHGSISGGAAESNLSVAAVSKRIADLEALAGVELIVRGARGVEVTQAGNELAAHAREIMDSLERLAGVMSDYASGVAGYVRIYANPSAVLQGLPEKIIRFNKDYPRVRVEVQEQLSAEVIEALRDRKAEVGIFAGNINYDGLHVTPFGSDRLTLIMTQDHPLAVHEFIYLREALDHEFVTQVDAATLNSVLLMTAKEEGRPLKLRHLMRGYDAVCRMVAVGMGLAVVPESAVGPAKKMYDGLHTVTLADPWACRPLLIGVRDPRNSLAVVRLMLSYLQDT